MPVDTSMIVAHAVVRIRTPLWIVPAGRAGADTVRGGGRRAASPPPPEQARKAPRRREAPDATASPASRPPSSS
eukprot:4158702-Alexandrium_andersonii.AAC.1